MHLDGMARAQWRMQVYWPPRPHVPAGAGANARSSDLTLSEGARLKKEAVLGDCGCGVCGAHLRDRLGPSLGCVVVLGASRSEHAEPRRQLRRHRCQVWASGRAVLREQALRGGGR